MRDARCGPSLAREASYQSFISRKRRTQHLDGYFLVHQDMRAAIDRAHATNAQALFDSILARKGLAKQRITACFECRSVERAKCAGVGIFCAAVRTFFHRQMVPFLLFTQRGLARA